MSVEPPFFEFTKRSVIPTTVPEKKSETSGEEIAGGVIVLFAIWIFVLTLFNPLWIGPLIFDDSSPMFFNSGILTSLTMIGVITVFCVLLIVVAAALFYAMDDIAKTAAKGSAYRRRERKRELDMMRCTHRDYS